MHSYLRAIGFSQIKSRKQLEKVYYEILHKPNRKIITTINAETSLIQFEKDFGPNFGIALIGEYDVSGALSIEHYFPYVKGNNMNEIDPMFFDKHVDKESYAGVSDDFKLGMTLIFYLQNIADYTKSSWFKKSNKVITKVKLGAMSSEGKIILPFYKTDSQAEFDEIVKRVEEILLEAAQEGDPKAMELLALNDIKTNGYFEMQSKEEDVLTLVETTFMPCGVECEHYSIIGLIKEFTLDKNMFSEEEVYNLLLEVNDLNINVCINRQDLLGEPEVGRRFKGDIWLQGHVIL